MTGMAAGSAGCAGFSFPRGTWPALTRCWPPEALGTLRAAMAVRVKLTLETGDTEPGPPAALPQAGRPAQRHSSSGRVLVLNASYEPINVCTVRRAAVLILKNRAEVLEKGDWALHAESFTLDRPVVIRLLTYVRFLELGRALGTAGMGALRTSAGQPHLA